MEVEDRKLVFDLIVKAYEHHKTHARFEETQRAWMVAAYFTFTGLVFAGVIKGMTSMLPALFSNLWIAALFAHFFIGILMMISVSKVSGEFRRHFSRAEKILSDVRELCNSDEFLRKAFRNVLLETAAIKEIKGGKEKRRKRKGIVLFSNAAIHAYMFAFLTAFDVYLMVVGIWEQQMVSAYPILAAALWFFGTSVAQHVYINLLERTGT